MRERCFGLFVVANLAICLPVPIRHPVRRHVMRTKENGGAFSRRRNVSFGVAVIRHLGNNRQWPH